MGLTQKMGRNNGFHVELLKYENPEKRRNPATVSSYGGRSDRRMDGEDAWLTRFVALPVGVTVFFLPPLGLLFW